MIDGIMIILVIGVSGSGKTTVGEKLAEALQYEFQDADDFHPPQNIEKMRQNIPLNDRDRQPWLQALNNAIQKWINLDKNVILACSALKTEYRKQLLVDADNIRLIYLQGSFELIENRLKQRSDHYMKADLLQSQFEALEEPQTGIKIDIAQPIEEIIQKIITELES
ncbi:MAG: gluconokinase [Microcoleaceae cyanobacterium]